MQESERLNNSNLVTPMSSHYGAPTTQRSYMSNAARQPIIQNQAPMGSQLTAPHGQAARAMNTSESRFQDTAGGLTYSASAVSEVSSSHHNASSYDTRADDNKSHLTSVSSQRFVDVIPDQPKIESKDHMWKPAPIMGRDFTQREIKEPEVNTMQRPLGAMPSSASLRTNDPMTNNYFA